MVQWIALLLYLILVVIVLCQYKGPGRSAKAPTTKAAAARQSLNPRQSQSETHRRDSTSSPPTKSARRSTPSVAMSKNQFVFAVMGVTGAGKSSFIKSITGRSDIKIGQGLSSETENVEAYDFTHGGIRFTLVDTPGFDDSRESEEEIANRVLQWLGHSVKKGTKLNGLVYLHRIIDPRMPGSALSNLRMFRSLVGAQNFQNVVLATSFWGKVTASEGERRELELRNNNEYWGLMVAKGAQMVRIYTDRESNLALLGKMAQTHRDKVLLEAQQEMLQGKSASETTAAQLVNAEVERWKRQKKAELEAERARLQTLMQQQDLKNRLDLARQQGRADHERLLQKVKENRAIRDSAREKQRALDREHDLERRRCAEQVSALASRIEALQAQSQALNRR